MDKLSIFNNEELLEVYAKVEEELNHLNESIIVEEGLEEPEPEESTEEKSDNSEEKEEEKEEKEEESNEQS